MFMGFVNVNVTRMGFVNVIVNVFPIRPPYIDRKCFGPNIGYET
jgi:hypothetical protein